MLHVWQFSFASQPSPYSVFGPRSNTKQTTKYLTSSGATRKHKGWTILWSKTKTNAKYGSCYEAERERKGWTILWSKTKKQRMAHFMKQNENAKDGPCYEAKWKRKGWTIVWSKTTSRSLHHKMVHPLLFRSFRFTNRCRSWCARHGRVYPTERETIVDPGRRGLSLSLSLSLSRWSNVFIGPCAPRDFGWDSSRSGRDNSKHIIIMCPAGATTSTTRWSADPHAVYL